MNRLRSHASPADYSWPKWPIFGSTSDLWKLGRVISEIVGRSFAGETEGKK